ncbi:MAG TPA: hypothetical protein VGE45_00535 [Chloroflexia bacterium]|jgi:hypothetical protein
MTAKDVTDVPGGKGYIVRVSDAHILDDPFGRGLVLVMQIKRPVELLDQCLVKVWDINPLKRGALAEATADMAKCGISLRRMVRGNMTGDLKGRYLEVNYTAPPSGSNNDFVEIVRRVRLPH